MRLKNYSPQNGRKFPTFGEKHIKLHIQEAEQTSNRIKPKKSTTIYIIVKFLKTKNKGKEQPKRKDRLVVEEKAMQMSSGFLIRNHQGQKEVAHFPRTERKEL